MPETYEYDIDGQQYAIDWSKPQPPTAADFNGIASSVRNTPGHQQAAWLTPRDPATEAALKNYAATFLQDGDKSTPHALLSRLTNLPPNERYNALPANLSDIGKLAIMRQAYTLAGMGAGRLYAPSAPAPPSTFQKGAAAVGDVLSYPGALAKAAIQPAEKSLNDALVSGGYGYENRSPGDIAAQAQTAQQPFLQRAKTLQHQDLRALAQPDKANALQNQYDKMSGPEKLATRGGTLLGTLAADPLTWAAGAAGPLLEASPALSKAVSGAFVGSQAAPYVADPSLIARDPAEFLANLPFLAMGLHHLAQSVPPGGLPRMPELPDGAAYQMGLDPTLGDPSQSAYSNVPPAHLSRAEQPFASLLTPDNVQGVGMPEEPRSLPYSDPNAPARPATRMQQGPLSYPPTDARLTSAGLDALEAQELPRHVSASRSAFAPTSAAEPFASGDRVTLDNGAPATVLDTRGSLLRVRDEATGQVRKVRSETVNASPSVPQEVSPSSTANSEATATAVPSASPSLPADELTQHLADLENAARQRLASRQVAPGSQPVEPSSGNVAESAPVPQSPVTETPAALPQTAQVEATPPVQRPVVMPPETPAVAQTPISVPRDTAPYSIDPHSGKITLDIPTAPEKPWTEYTKQEAVHFWQDIRPTIPEPILKELEAAKNAAHEQYGRQKRSASGEFDRRPQSEIDALIKAQAEATWDTIRARESGREIQAAPAPTGERPGLPAPDVQIVPTNALATDPERFQYKQNPGQGGQTGSIPADVPYNPQLAGTLHVWQDPEGGQTYVVNGHNRYARALRDNAPTQEVRYLHAPTAEDARIQGAILNIGEGRGNAIDAATLFRETGLTAAKLREHGISLSSSIARDGMALSKLEPALFGAVKRGELDLAHGAALGAADLTPDQQFQAVRLLQKATAQGKKVTPGVASEIAQMVKASPTMTKSESNLFGNEDRALSLAVEKAGLADHVRQALTRAKTTFQFNANDERASALQEAGNKIETQENAQRAAKLSRMQADFDRLKHQPGVIADALNDAARRVGEGQNEPSIRKQLVRTVETALQSLDADRAGQPPVGSEAASGRSALLDTGRTDNAHAAAEENGANTGAVAEPQNPADRLKTAQASLADVEQSLKDRITNRQRGLQSGINPEDLRDLTLLGAVKIARGALTFADFSRQMLADFGDTLRPHLHGLYQAALDHYHAEIAPRFGLPRVNGEETSAVPSSGEREPTEAETSPTPSLLASARKIQADRMTPSAVSPSETASARQETGNSTGATDAANHHAGNINLDRLQTGEDVKQAVTETARQMAGDIERARGGRISQAETIQAAKDLGLHPKQLKQATPGEGAAYALALRQLMVERAETVRAAEADYRRDPSPDHQAALGLATKEYQTVLLSAAGHAAEAGRALAQYKILAEAARAPETPDALFTPVREAVNPRARDFGDRNQLFTADRAEAAKQRVQQKLSRLNAGVDPSLLPDLLEVGGFYLEGGLREFGAWAQQMRANVASSLDDGTLQHVWANLRAEVAQRQQTRAVSEVFVDRLAGRLGRDGARNFVNALADDDGSPTTLSALLSGQDLTPQQQQAIGQAFLDHQPVRTNKVERNAAMLTLNGILEDARQASRDAATANKPAPTPREQFLSRLTRQLGKDGAETFLQRIDSDGQGSVLRQLVQGESLTPADRQQVAEAFLSLQKPKAAPAELDAASQTLKEIVAEAREQAKPPAASVEETPKEIARRLLLEDGKADADRISQRLANIGDNDLAGLSRVMRQESKIGLPEQILAVRKAGLLSSPRTIAKVLVSHGLYLGAEELARIPASLMDAVIGLKTGERTVLGPKPLDLVKAATEGAVRGSKEALQILRHGETGAVQAGMEPIGRQTADALFGDVHTKSVIADAYINGITRLHGAAYRPFKVYAFTRALTEQARLLADNEGLTGDAYRTRFKSLLDDPTEAMSARAVEAAEHAVFLNPNAATQAIGGVKRTLKASGSLGTLAVHALDFVAPVQTVPTNLIGRMLEYATGGVYAPLRALGEARQGLPFDAEAQKRFSETFGRGLTGAGVMALGALLASHKQATGLTGKDKRASVTVGGRTYEVSALAPMGNLFALGATLHEMQGLAKRGQPLPLRETATALLSEQPYLHAAADLLDPRDPNGTKYLGNAAGSFVPTVLSDIAAQMDNQRRKPKSVLQYVENRLPHYREKLPGTGKPESNRLFDPFNSHRGR